MHMKLIILLTLFFSGITGAAVFEVLESTGYSTLETRLMSDDEILTIVPLERKSTWSDTENFYVEYGVKPLAVRIGQVLTHGEVPIVITISKIVCYGKEETCLDREINVQEHAIKNDSAKEVFVDKYQNVSHPKLELSDTELSEKTGVGIASKEKQAELEPIKQKSIFEIIGEIVSAFFGGMGF